MMFLRSHPQAFLEGQHMTDHVNHAYLASIVVSTVLCVSTTPAYATCEPAFLAESIDLAAPQNQ